MAHFDDKRHAKLIVEIAEAELPGHEARMASLCYELVSMPQGRNFVAREMEAALHRPKLGSFWMRQGLVEGILLAWPGSNASKAQAWEGVAELVGKPELSWILEIMMKAISAHPVELKLLGVALNRACATGALDAVENLLCLGAEPNLKLSIDQRTPLMFAAAGGHLDICQALLEFGAKTQIKDKDGRTALQCCSRDKVDELRSMTERWELGAATPTAPLPSPKPALIRRL